MTNEWDWKGSKPDGKRQISIRSHKNMYRYAMRGSHVAKAILSQLNGTNAVSIPTGSHFTVEHF